MADKTIDDAISRHRDVHPIRIKNNIPHQEITPTPTTIDQMDLIQLIADLNSHYIVLNAEIAEIDKDISRMDSLCEKYADYWAKGRKKLLNLKKHKLKLVQDISFELELLSAHQPAGSDLLAKLNRVQSASTETVAPPQIYSKSDILSGIPNPTLGTDGVLVNACTYVTIADVKRSSAAATGRKPAHGRNTGRSPAVTVSRAVIPADHRV